MCVCVNTNLTLLVLVVVEAITCIHITQAHLYCCARVKPTEAHTGMRVWAPQSTNTIHTALAMRVGVCVGVKPQVVMLGARSAAKHTHTGLPNKQVNTQAYRERERIEKSKAPLMMMSAGMVMAICQTNHNKLTPLTHSLSQFTF